MSLVINIYYKGKGDSARKFAEEMEKTGVADRVRNERGNLSYEYFYPKNDETTVLLIDKWTDEKALDIHHKSPMMDEIAVLRKKYSLSMRVERFTEIK